MEAFSLLSRRRSVFKVFSSSEALLADRPTRSSPFLIAYPSDLMLLDKRERILLWIALISDNLPAPVNSGEADRLRG